MNLVYGKLKSAYNKHPNFFSGTKVLLIAKHGVRFDFFFSVRFYSRPHIYHTPICTSLHIEQNLRFSFFFGGAGPIKSHTDVELNNYKYGVYSVLTM